MLEPVSLVHQRVLSFENAMLPLADVVSHQEQVVFEATDFAEATALPGFSPEYVMAIHAYTQAGELFRVLNAALRDADRRRVEPFKPYLRLFITAVEALGAKLGVRAVPQLFRGVPEDLRPLG